MRSRGFAAPPLLYRVYALYSTNAEGGLLARSELHDARTHALQTTVRPPTHAMQGLTLHTHERATHEHEAVYVLTFSCRQQRHVRGTERGWGERVRVTLDEEGVRVGGIRIQVGFENHCDQWDGGKLLREVAGAWRRMRTINAACVFIHRCVLCELRPWPLRSLCFIHASRHGE